MVRRIPGLISSGFSRQEAQSRHPADQSRCSVRTPTPGMCRKEVRSICVPPTIGPVGSFQVGRISPARDSLNGFVVWQQSRNQKGDTPGCMQCAYWLYAHLINTEVSDQAEQLRWRSQFVCTSVETDLVFAVRLVFPLPLPALLRDFLPLPLPPARTLAFFPLPLCPLPLPLPLPLPPSRA